MSNPVNTAYPYRLSALTVDEGGDMLRPHAILKATTLGLLLASVPVPAAHAVDGVIEINQARAKAGGVTPTDNPLLPVSINQAGSYRLTGNLDVTDNSARPSGTMAENMTAITVTADNVTIDLNGFTIKGPNVCSGTPLVCNAVGTGAGIALGTSSVTAVTVFNGIVRGMGGVGVSLGLSARVDGVQAESNGGAGIVTGINTGAGSLVTNCTANRNGGTGVAAVTISNSSATENKGGGFAGFTMTGCSAFQNEGTGFSGFTVTNSTAVGNGGTGIFAQTVANCLANGNTFDGIDATTVTGSTATGNTGNQITATGIDDHNICNAATCP
jgi:hypothetical protein